MSQRIAGEIDARHPARRHCRNPVAVIARTGAAVGRADDPAGGGAVAAGRADLPLPLGAHAGRGRGDCRDGRGPARAAARPQPADDPRTAGSRCLGRELAAPCARPAARPSGSPAPRTTRGRQPDRRCGRHALAPAPLQRDGARRCATRHRAGLRHRPSAPRADLFAQLFRAAQRRPRPRGDGRLHRGAARRPVRRLRDGDLFAGGAARPAVDRRRRARP